MSEDDYHSTLFGPVRDTYSGGYHNPSANSAFLPTGSQAWQGAWNREREEESSSSSSGSASGGGEGGGAGILLILLAPPFVAPGYALYRTWVALSATRWHPLFIILAEGAEVFAVCATLWLLYRFVPRVVGALLAAIYIGACYGEALHRMGGNDHWAIGFGLATAIGGYFVGRSMHKSIASSMTTFSSAGRGIAGSYSALSMMFSFLIYGATSFGGGGWAVWKLYKFADYNRWSGLGTFAFCCALGAAAIFVPPFLGKKLVKFAPRRFAQTVTMGAFALAAGVITNLIGLDPVWTGAAIITAAVGGWGMTSVLAE